MGRRREEASGVNTQNLSSGAWEAARNALGRLIARGVVRELSVARLNPEGVVSERDVLAPPPIAPGPSESRWQVTAEIAPGSLTQIEVALSDKDLRPEARLIEGNGAVTLPECHAMPFLEASRLSVESVAGIVPAEILDLTDAQMKVPAEPLKLGQIAGISSPNLASFPGLNLAVPKGSGLLVRRLPAARIGPTEKGESIISSLSFPRLGLEAPRGVHFKEAFAAEHRRLAAAAALPPFDVTLLGIYPSIPIAAIRRLVVEEEGRQLRLWLKSEAWWTKRSPQRITLLIGRQNSTGKMLQAAG